MCLAFGALLGFTPHVLCSPVLGTLTNRTSGYPIKLWFGLVRGVAPRPCRGNSRHHLTYLLKIQLFNFLGNMGYMSVKD